MATQTALFTHRYSASNSSSEDTGILSTRRDMAAARMGLRERQMNVPAPSSTPRLDAWRRSKYGGDENKAPVASSSDEGPRFRGSAPRTKDNTNSVEHRRTLKPRPSSQTSTLRGAYESIVTREQQDREPLTRNGGIEALAGRANTPNFRVDGPDGSPSPAGRVRVWGSKSKVGSSWLQRHMDGENASKARNTATEDIKESAKPSGLAPTGVTFVPPARNSDWDAEFTEASIEVSNSPRLKPSTYLPTPPRNGLNVPNGDTRLSPPRANFEVNDDRKLLDKIDNDPDIPLSPMFDGIPPQNPSSDTDYNVPLSPLFKDDQEKAYPLPQFEPFTSKLPQRAVSGSEAKANISGRVSDLKRFQKISDRRPLFSRKETESAAPAEFEVGNEEDKPVRNSQKEVAADEKLSKSEEVIQPGTTKLPRPEIQKLSSSEIVQRLSPELTASELKRRQSISQLARRQSQATPISKKKSTDSLEALRDLSRVLSPETAAIAVLDTAQTKPVVSKSLFEVSIAPASIEEPAKVMPKPPTEAKVDAAVISRIPEPVTVPPIEIQDSATKQPTLSEDSKTIDTLDVTKEPRKAEAKKIVHQLINTATPASASEDVRQILAEMDAEAILNQDSNSGSLLALNAKLQHSLASIRESREGIEAMENTISVTDAVISTKEATLSQSSSDGNWVNISIYRPRFWKHDAKGWLDLTRLAWVLLLVFLWANAEDFAHCSVGRVQSLSYYEPIDPDRPEWGLALPYVVRKVVWRVMDLMRD